MGKVSGVGFSAPGLYYQTRQFDIAEVSLQDSFTNIQPNNDVVPRVDTQRGMIQWLYCDLDPISCHKLTHTACELWAQCGDQRDRDWRKTCKRWYTKRLLNLAPDGSRDLGAKRHNLL